MLSFPVISSNTGRWCDLQVQFRKNALWGQRRQWAPITLSGLASAQLAIFCSIRFKTYVLNTYYVYCVNWKNLQFSLLLWVFVTLTQLTLLVTKCTGFPPQQVILCRTPAGCSIQFNSIFNPIHLEMASDPTGWGLSPTRMFPSSFRWQSQIAGPQVIHNFCLGY